MLSTAYENFMLLLRFCTVPPKRSYIYLIALPIAPIPSPPETTNPLNLTQVWATVFGFAGAFPLVGMAL